MDAISLKSAISSIETGHKICQHLQVIFHINIFQISIEFPISFEVSGE